MPSKRWIRDDVDARAAPTLAVAVTLLLRLADCRHCLCDDGDRGDDAHGIFAAATTADRRVWLGAGRCRRRLLVRVFALGGHQPDRRPDHGSTRAAPADRN